MNRRYVKLDMEHADYLAVLSVCREAFAVALPSNQFSVSASPDGSVCWLLTTANVDPSEGGAVLDVQDGGNSRARADLADWYPPPVGPA